MNFRRLSRNLEQIHDRMKVETDRGCALWAAAMLDEKLEELLRSVLLDDKKRLKEFMTGVGPIASLAARTMLLYLIGIISKDNFDRYRAIRKIRNEFAHCADELSFDSPGIAKYCDVLASPKLRIAEFTNRQNYIRTVAVLLEGINQRIQELKPLVLNNVYSTLLEVEQAIYQQYDQIETDE